MTDALAGPGDKPIIDLADEDCARLELVARLREVVGQQPGNATTCRHPDARGRDTDRSRDLLTTFSA